MAVAAATWAGTCETYAAAKMDGHPVSVPRKWCPFPLTMGTVAVCLLTTVGPCDLWVRLESRSHECCSHGPWWRRLWLCLQGSCMRSGQGRFRCHAVSPGTVFPKGPGGENEKDTSANGTQMPLGKDKRPGYFNDRWEDTHRWTRAVSDQDRRCCASHRGGM